MKSLTMPVSASVIADPDTYVTGVPYELLAELRSRHPVVRVDEPGGSGVCIGGLRTWPDP